MSSRSVLPTSSAREYLSFVVGAVVAGRGQAAPGRLSPSCHGSSSSDPSSSEWSLRSLPPSDRWARRRPARACLADRPVLGLASGRRFAFLFDRGSPWSPRMASMAVCRPVELPNLVAL